MLFRSGQPLRRKQIIADKYVIILKHDPMGKFSARSSAFLSLKNLPSKELNMQKHIAPYSKTPVANGEMETFNRIISMLPYTLANSFNKFSVSRLCREGYITESLTKDPYNFYSDFTPIAPDNSNRLILDVLLQSVGRKLVVEKSPVQRSDFINDEDIEKEDEEE